MSKVFYVPGTRWNADSVELVDGKEVGKWTGKTLAELQEKEPTMICITAEEATKKIMSLAIKPAEEITEDLFIERLEVLPPCSWVRNRADESFHMSEFDVCDITGIYVRIGKRYFCLHDDYKLTHQERLQKVRDVFDDL